MDKLISRSLSIIVGLIFLSQMGMAIASQTCEEENRLYDECKRRGRTSCNRALVRAYTEDLYLPLNEALRGITVNPECLKTARRLKSILASLPRVRGKIYRGVVLVPALRELTPNTCVKDHAFLSASLDDQIAYEFASKGPNIAFLTIRTTSGRNISTLSRHPEEKEVLLLPEVLLKLTKRDDISSTNVEFEFQEVPASSCRNIVNLATELNPKILVEDATYGGNLTLRNKGNATDAAADYCNGAETCDYLVSDRYLIDPDPIRSKSFNVRWSCLKGLNSKKTHSITIPAPANHAEFKFGCDSRGNKVFELKWLNTEYVHIKILSAITSKRRNVTSEVQEELTEKHSIFSLEMRSDGLGFNDDEKKLPGLTIRYACVKKTGSRIKTLRLKETEDFQFEGDLNCLQL